MKKWMIFLSYPGIGILLFITGIEIFQKKKPFDFWIKFCGATIGLTLLLIFLPLGLVSILLLPHIPAHSVWLDIVGGLELVYLYASGVFVCYRQLTMREQFDKSHS